MRTIRQFILLRKARREASMFACGRKLWKRLTGWDNGGNAIPGYVAVTECQEHKNIREKAWNHYKMMRVYHIALIRLGKFKIKGESK